MCFAMKNATSSERLSDTASAFLRMIATRISCSGGSIATVRPQEKRDLRRSSIPARSLG
jgi:hypothetical protein